MAFELSARLAALPPYLFKELDRVRDEVKAKGVDIIDLGVGDPDRPTPPAIAAALKKAADDPANHKYPLYSGTGAFRAVVAGWYKKRHNVDLDPATEICSLIGSKEGIAHFPNNPTGATATLDFTPNWWPRPSALKRPPAAWPGLSFETGGRGR